MSNNMDKNKKLSDNQKTAKKTYSHNSLFIVVFI